MSDSILGIGLSALAAAQAGLTTTGHNISNVNTPGYSRQETLQTTRPPLFTGAGYVGQGVNVDDVRRIYSDFLDARVVQTQAGASSLSALQGQLDQLDGIFADPASGVGAAVDQFFAGMNALAANPGDTAARQSALSAAQSLVTRFHQIDGQLGALRDATDKRIQGSVTTINSLAGQLASLNKQILESPSSASPNDLLDQRDNLIAALNQEIGAHAVPQGDGTYNVFLSNGVALVTGLQVNKVAAVPDAENPAELQIALQTGSGYLRFRSTDFSGGALAGTLAFRDQHLDAATNALGRIAIALGATVNAQQALGLDQNGASGGPLFSLPAPVVVPASTNTGNASIAATLADATALTGSDYRLAFDGTNFQLTRLADGSVQTFASLPQTVDGLTLAVSGGTPAAGDAFLLMPTRNGAGDLALAIKDTAGLAAAGPVRSGIGSSNTGTGAISPPTVDASFLAAPLGGTVTLAYSSTTGQLTGFPATQAVTVTTAGGTSTTYAPGAGVPYAAGATISFGGISFTLSGAPANGDTFSVARNTGGNSDGRNAQLMTALARAATVGGKATFASAYAELVSTIGSAAQEAGAESDTQDKLLTQAKAAQSSVSGVNLDEEAANLQRYQQAYQAAGKLMAIASTLFDTILALGQ